MLKWRHPHPAEIVNFKLFFADDEAQKSSPRSIDVGLPEAGGMYLWTIEVPEGGSIWVAVSAVDRDGRESELSEWRRLDWRPPSRRLGSPGRAVLAK